MNKRLILLNLISIFCLISPMDYQNTNDQLLDELFTLSNQLRFINEAAIKLTTVNQLYESSDFAQAIKNKDISTIKRLLNVPDIRSHLDILIKLADNNFFLFIISEIPQLLVNELVRKHFVDIVSTSHRDFFQEVNNEQVIQHFFNNATTNDIELLLKSIEYLRCDSRVENYYETRLADAEIIALADKKCIDLLDILSKEVEIAGSLPLDITQHKQLQKIANLTKVIRDLNVHPLEKFLAREMLLHGYSKIMRSGVAQLEQMEIKAISNADVFISKLKRNGSAFSMGLIQGLQERSNAIIADPIKAAKDVILANASLVLNLCQFLDTVDDEKTFVGMFVPEVAKRHQQEIDVYHEELKTVLSQMDNFSSEDWGRVLGSMLIDVVAFKAAKKFSHVIKSTNPANFIDVLSVIEHHIPDAKTARMVTKRLEEVVAKGNFIAAPLGIPELSWDNLSYDPAQGRRNEKSIREAIMGLVAQDQGFLRGPLIRDIRSHGGEFFENRGLGQLWDVKRAWSKYFNCDEWCSKIKKELLKINDGLLENIIIDAIDLTNEHLFDLIKKLKFDLTAEELKRVIVVLSNENVFKLQRLGINIPIYKPQQNNWKEIIPAIGSIETLEMLLKDTAITEILEKSKMDDASGASVKSDFRIELPTNNLKLKDAFPFRTNNFGNSELISFGANTEKKLGFKHVQNMYDVSKTELCKKTEELENKEVERDIELVSRQGGSQIGIRVSASPWSVRLARYEIQKSTQLAMSIYAYLNNKNVRDLIDKRRNEARSLVLNCLTSQDLALTLASRRRLLDLRIPGWLGEDTKDFLYDIVPYFLDKNGNINTEEVIDNDLVLTIVFNYLKSLCLDETEYKRTCDMIKQLNIEKFTGLVAQDSVKEFKHQHYQVNSAGVLSDMRDLIGYGPASSRQAALQNAFNRDLFELLKCCKKYDFDSAREIIHRHVDIQQRQLTRIFSYYYNRIYDEYGIISLFQQDPLYKRIDENDKKRLFKDNIARASFNRALVLRNQYKKYLERKESFHSLTEEQIYNFIDSMLINVID